MKVREIGAALDELAPPGLAFDSDRVGLLIGHPEWEVSRVLVALTVTPEAAKTAIRKHAELIVSHHPVLWEPLRALRTDTPHTRMCLELAEARIACFAAHTNLDIVSGGVNDTLADLLGIQKRMPLLHTPQTGLFKLVTFVPEAHLAKVRDAVCRAGAGVIGEYSFCTFSAGGMGTFLPSEEATPFSGERQRINEEPERRFETLVPKARMGAAIKALLHAHPYEEVAYDVLPLENKDPRLGLGVYGVIDQPLTLRLFAERVCQALAVSHVRIVGRPDRRIRRVAVLGGSGGSHVADVLPDVDVFVTGDVDYHDALAAQERGLAVIDAGHAGLEKCIVPVLVRFLRQRSKDLRVVPFDEPEVFHVVEP